MRIVHLRLNMLARQKHSFSPTKEKPPGMAKLYLVQKKESRS
jgi:hypothetical protein